MVFGCVMMGLLSLLCQSVVGRECIGDMKVMSLQWTRSFMRPCCSFYTLDAAV
jgi:hypothetical protein